jgi:hypothetical protein
MHYHQLLRLHRQERTQQEVVAAGVVIEARCKAQEQSMPYYLKLAHFFL